MHKIMLILAASLLLAVPSAMAQPMERGMMGMADELKLTDQQLDQMQQLQLQHQRKMVPLQADLKLARLELKEIMMQAQIDQKAALARQDKVSSIKAQIAKAKLEHRLDARKVLTEDQLKLQRSMGRKMKQGRGQGQGPCSGCPMGDGHRGMRGPGMMGHGPMGGGNQNGD